MGAGMTSSEIIVFNKRLETLKKLLNDKGTN